MALEIFDIAAIFFLWEKSLFFLFFNIKLFYHCIYMVYLIRYMFYNSQLCIKSQSMIFYIVCILNICLWNL